MGAHDMDETVLGTAAVGGAIGEQDGGASDAEKTVGDEHRFSVAKIPVLGDVLGADDDGIGVAVDLEEVAGKVNGDDASAATHAPEVEAEDIAA
ncbi:hypothetical protein IEQ34_003523 [Dendrobium chrysotoxum]|uniref:Uncharacterized protein n=1 Tax=Dendrobium chrysotoxum TaxID=161865 RepID=A0AAV7HJY5_DENCH|nr:hypothetical protein IEQ34_003523 [Dendrobium chrysotoxum]